MKKVNFLVLLLSVITLSLLSCKSAKDIPVMKLNDKWVLKTFEGKDVKESFEGKIPTMEINITEKTVHGNGGCNNYNGKFNLNKNQFSAPNVASTMMMCPASNQEGKFFQYLGTASVISLDGEDLIFTQDGKQVMTFSKAKPLTVQDLNGSWSLMAMQGASTNVNFKMSFPSIEFDPAKNTVSGSAGCNRYHGAFSFAEGKLTLSDLATTRMACEDLEGETKFIQLLSGTNDIEIDEDMLILRKNSLEQLRFVKK